MRKFLLVLCLVLALSLGSGVVFAGGNDNHDVITNITNQGGQGGQGGKGGDGGNALAISGSNSSARSDASAAAISVTDVDVRNDVRTSQGQVQGQVAVNEGNKNEINIKAEKQFLAAPSTSAPEVNHGSGKVDWGFCAVRFGIQEYYSDENIKSLIREEHNVKADDLISTVLKMKEKEGAITYNTRIIIVEKEAQKSYALSIIGVPAGGGALGTTGVAGSAVVGPSFAGTKANNLYSIFFVKVQ